MFTIRYAGDIESRRSQGSNDRTLADFKKSNPEFMSKWAEKKTKVQPPKATKLPTATDFPTMISTMPAKQENFEIDQAILYDLEKSFYEEDYLYNQYINEYLEMEPYMEFVNEEEFLQFHFNEDSTFYSE